LTRALDNMSVPSYSRREAEKVEMYDLPETDWWNPKEGSFVTDSSASRSSGRIIDVNYEGEADQAGNVTTRGSILLIHNENNPLIVWNGSSAVVALGPNQISSGKMAIRYAHNDFAVTANGLTPETDTTGNVPEATQLNIGGRGVDDDVIIDGHVRKVSYYARPLSDTELMNITEND
jgi:hypothetical protein